MNPRLIVLAAVVLVTCRAALVAQAFSTVSGSIVDQSGAALPGVAVTAYSTDRNARQEGVTDASGRFELIGLAQGSYRLEAELPGFERSQQTLTLAGQDVTRDFILELGALEEMVTVIYDRNSPLDVPRERLAPLPPSCEPSTDDGGARERIGGQIRQPRKLYHVSPIYPEGVPPGVVKIDAIIGTDGLVTGTTLTNDAPGALARAAADAVRQWEFDPTLLNCQAVEVRMSVTVDFR